MLTWIPLGLILGVNFNQWLLGATVGIFSSVLGQAIYIYVLGKGELSITATLLASFPVYTILFSVLFNHERLNTFSIIFIFIAIVGTLVVSLPDRIDKGELKKINYILWAVFAAACIGAADTLTKFYINKTTVGSFLFYVAIAQFPVSFIFLRFEKQPLSQFKEFIKRFSKYQNAFLGSLFVSTATMFLFLSFNFTLASIASPIAGTAPAITIILALIFLKDNITPKNWLGLILVIASIICLGITSS